MNNCENKVHELLQKATPDEYEKQAFFTRFGLTHRSYFCYTYESR